MALPERSWKEKAHDFHKRQHPVVRRLVVAIIGGALLLVGGALLVLPGPGLLVIAAGVAVLSLEFEWASKLLHRIETAIESVRARIKRR